jgi:uncharacterized protein (DUF2237 family)
VEKSAEEQHTAEPAPRRGVAAEPVTSAAGMAWAAPLRSAALPALLVVATAVIAVSALPPPITGSSEAADVDARKAEGGRASLQRAGTEGAPGPGRGSGPLNILGGPLQVCGTAPVTGYFRDGYCRTDTSDAGSHVVCAEVTAPFLAHTAARGNDLVTPRPGFAGLAPGDRWCLCGARWAEADRADVAPPVVAAASHARALNFASLPRLTARSVEAGALEGLASAAIER